MTEDEKKLTPQQQAEEEERDFQKRYKEALKRYRAGERDVVFPAGTWKMRVLFNVRVEGEEK